jgi:hypothetical protein
MSLGETGATHAGDDGTRARRPVSDHGDAPGVELPAVADQARAMIFGRRLGSLDVTDLEAVAQVWRRAIAEDPRGWFASESAAAHVVRAAGRERDQEAVIAALIDVVRRRGWGRLDYPDGATRPGFTEESVQYTATLAAIALVVRDVLPAQDLELIYAPFAALIPLSEVEHGAVNP